MLKFKHGYKGHDQLSCCTYAKDAAFGLQYWYAAMTRDLKPPPLDAQEALRRGEPYLHIAGSYMLPERGNEMIRCVSATCERMYNKVPPIPVREKYTDEEYEADCLQILEWLAGEGYIEWEKKKDSD